MRTRSWVLAALIVTVSLPALAEPSEAAKTAAREFTAQAADALDKKDFPRAFEYFDKAFALVPAPTLALGKARALVGMGKYKKALEVYKAMIKEGAPANAKPPILRAIESAKTESAALEPKLGSLVITPAAGITATVTLDGESVPASSLGTKQVVDPGDHDVVATAEGRKKFARTVKVAEGASATVALELPVPDKPAPLIPGPAGTTQQPDPGNPGALPPESDAGGAPRKGSTQRTIGWVTLGVGGASLIAGGVLGGIGLSKRSGLKDDCPNNSCPPQHWKDVDAVTTYRTFSSVFLYGGLALAATGTVLVLTSPSKRSETVAYTSTPPKSATWISPYVGAGQAGFTGGFLAGDS